MQKADPPTSRKMRRSILPAGMLLFGAVGFAEAVALGDPWAAPAHGLDATGRPHPLVRAGVDEADAIRQIERVGGKVLRDDKTPGRPVVSVVFSPGHFPHVQQVLPAVNCLRSLRILGLFYTDTTDAGLAELRELDELKQLDLAGLQITDAGISEIIRHRRLGSLGIPNSTRRSIHWAISSRSFSDNWLRALPKEYCRGKGVCEASWSPACVALMVTSLRSSSLHSRWTSPLDSSRSRMPTRVLGLRWILREMSTEVMEPFSTTASRHINCGDVIRCSAASFRESMSVARIICRIELRMRRSCAFLLWFRNAVALVCPFLWHSLLQTWSSFVCLYAKLCVLSFHYNSNDC